MSLYRILSQEQRKNHRSEIRNCVYGILSLDDVIENMVVSKEEIDVKYIMRLEKLYADIKAVVGKYLNTREQLVFYLYIDLGKNIADIKKACNFGCWFTAYAHVVRMFKLIKLYYKYERMDKSRINKVLNESFTDNERTIIDLLHKRYSYPEISKLIKCYYRKTYYDCQDILKRLEERLPDYSKFITELRKFKRLNDFDVTIISGV